MRPLRWAVCGAVGLLAPVAALAADAPWPSLVTWQPDARAVRSGLYIAPRPPARRERVAFTVTEPSGVARKDWPVRGAIPLYRGELGDASQIRLLGDAGQEIPVQGKATAYWPEKTIRFLCIDFVTSLGPRQEKRFTLEYGSAVRPKAASPLKVTAEGQTGRLVVETGRLVLRFQPGREFLRLAPAGGARGGSPGPVTGRAVVCGSEKADDPTQHPLVIDAVRATEVGPVQATVHLLGHYGGEKAFQPADPADKDVWRYPVSMFFRAYAATGRVYIEHTFGYNGDEYHDFVQSYGLTFPTGRSQGTFLYGKDDGGAGEAPLGVRLNQFAHDQWALTGRGSAAGNRFGGWGAVDGGSLRVLLALREAWQNWPVALRAEADSGLTYEILGERPDRALDPRYEQDGGKPLRMIDSHSMFFGPKLTLYYSSSDTSIMRGRARGLKKVHELLLDVSAGEPRAAAAATGRAHQQPLVPWPGQQRYKDTKALGHIGVYGEPQWDFLNHYFSVMFDGLTMTHEANGLYGWVDWGDLPMCNRPKAGRFQMEMDGGVGWSNAERALAPYFYHYAAGGGRRFLDLGRAMVHHTLGIDTEHPGGDDKHGGYHRHNQVHWRHKGAGTRQGGYRGWHNYYWLTGDPEVGRLILLEGLDSPAQRTIMDLRAERKQLRIGYDYQHCASHLLAHCCWITTGDWRYARGHRPVVKLWWISGEQSSPTRQGWVFFDVTDGEPTGYRLGKPGPQLGYWLTYGGDDLLLEWASLTGDPNAVDALLMQGKFHGRDGLAGGVQYLYHSPEALYLALAFLQPGHPHLKRLLAGRLWSHPNLKRFREKALRTTGVYESAEDWDRYGAYLYWKNGFSIHGAQGLEVLHLMRAMELLKMQP
jgi:hypothetical protein